VERLALVTGGSGFIGSHVVDELIDAGYRVRCAVRSTSDRRWLEGRQLELVEADLARGEPEDLDRLRRLVEGVDVTFHVAGLTRGSAAALERVNVEGTRRLAQALVDAGGSGRLVFCSSLAAAGPATLERPRRDEDPLRPTSDYGRSKRAAEDVLGGMRELDVTILRPAAVYGPRDRDTLPFFRMANHGLALTPGWRPRRLQLVHGRDVAAAMRLAAERPEASGRAFFVAHPATPGWPEVLAAMRSAVGRRVLALPLPSPFVLAAGWLAGTFAGKRQGQLDLRRARDMVVRAWTADVSATQRILSWTPAFDLRRGFEDTARWYRDEGWL